MARRPAKAAALLFRDALSAAGVAVDGHVGVRASPKTTLLVARSLSAPLTSIVTFMDLNSDNFTAEMLLKLLALTSYDRGTTATGREGRHALAEVGRDPDRRSSHRRRLRALAGRPTDGRHARRHPSGVLHRPRARGRAAARASRRRRQRHAQAPDAKRRRCCGTSRRRPARRSSPRPSPATSTRTSPSRSSRTGTRSTTGGPARRRTASRRC